LAIKYLDAKRIRGSSTADYPSGMGSSGDATSNDADSSTGNLGTTHKLGTGSLDFDGTEKIVANGLLNAMNTAGSISLWFNAAQDEDAMLFAFCATGSNTKIEIATQTTDTISCQLKINTTQQWAVNSTSTYSNAGTWNHIVFTHDGTIPKIYINGSLASMNRSSENNNTKWWTALRDAGANGIAIGSKAPLNGASYNEFFEGKLDDIGIWDRALTPDEVRILYNNNDSTAQLASVIPSGLKAYYNCDSTTVTNSAIPVDEKAALVTSAISHDQAITTDSRTFGVGSRKALGVKILANHYLVGKTITQFQLVVNRDNDGAGTVRVYVIRDGSGSGGNDQEAVSDAVTVPSTTSGYSTLNTTFTFSGGVEIEADDIIAIVRDDAGTLTGVCQTRTENSDVDSNARLVSIDNNSATSFEHGDFSTVDNDDLMYKATGASASSDLPENTLFDETDTYKTYWLKSNEWRPRTPTYGTTDFTSDWVNFGTAASFVKTSTQLTITQNTTTSSGVYYDLGTGNLGDSDFCLRWKFRLTSYDANNPTGGGSGTGNPMLFTTLSDDIVANATSGGENDALVSFVYGASGVYSSSADGQRVDSTSDQAYLSNNEAINTSVIYSMEMIRDGSNYILNVWKDSDYSGTPNQTRTLAYDSDITGLRYIKFQNSYQGNFVGYIKDVKFWAGVTEP